MSYATKFAAEQWVGSVWAVVVLNGEAIGFPCAFGGQQSMESYAAQLNRTKGILYDPQATQSKEQVSA